MSDGEMRDYDDDESEVDDVLSTGSASDPPNVVLAKIFMSTPNPANSQSPIIAEWDGEDPGHTKRLFVYAHIDNSTYANYVSVPTLKKNQRAKNIYRGEAFTPDYVNLMHTGRVSNYLQSSIHNPRAYDASNWPYYSELETLLRNLMSGRPSFVNGIDVLDLHRIYVFDMHTTLGLTYTGHPEVTNPVYTYWYRLNRQDKVTQGPPGRETIRDIPEHEFTSNYKIFSNFNIAHHNQFVFRRETFGNFGKMPKSIHKLNKPSKYRSFHPTPRRNSTARRGGKKRNKTRRKYRKIKSRRRRVMR